MGQICVPQVGVTGQAGFHVVIKFCVLVYTSVYMYGCMCVLRVMYLCMYILHVCMYACMNKCA